MKATFAPNLRRALWITVAAGELLAFGSARSQTAQAHAQAERKTTMTMKDDLANRSRPLARMVSYTFPTSLPSLNLVQRIYSELKVLAKRLSFDR